MHIDNKILVFLNVCNLLKVYFDVPILVMILYSDPGDKQTGEDPM